MKKSFTIMQSLLLLMILFTSIYFIFTQFYSLWNYKESLSKNKEIAKLTISDTKPISSIPKVSENFEITNTVKVKYFYFINKDEAVAFRSEEGNVLYLELKEGITKSKFETLKFTTTPNEPFEVKLERPNLITVKFIGEFKASLEDSFFSVNDGSEEVYRVSYFKYSGNMIPKDKNYIPTYNPEDF